MIRWKEHVTVHAVSEASVPAAPALSGSFALQALFRNTASKHLQAFFRNDRVLRTFDQQEIPAAKGRCRRGEGSGAAQRSRIFRKVRIGPQKALSHQHSYPIHIYPVCLDAQMYDIL